MTKEFCDCVLKVWPVFFFFGSVQLQMRLKPFLNLYEISFKFLKQQQTWLNSRLGSFDPETIVKETEEFEKNLGRVQDRLPDIADVRYLVTQVEGKLREFHLFLPLIRTLGNPALRFLYLINSALD